MWNIAGGKTKMKLHLFNFKETMRISIIKESYGELYSCEELKIINCDELSQLSSMA